ncbi:kinase-like domain-containing protein [Xylariaceae sp. FL0016]|nr:kinase-like domain-containing protein [Xylariaceae sp. FL0016]
MQPINGRPGFTQFEEWEPNSVVAIKCMGRLQEVKEFFDNNDSYSGLGQGRGGPEYKYQKTLGKGGQGLCAHYKSMLDDTKGLPRDIVLKVGLDGWENRAVRYEKQQLSKYKRAAHIVQAIDQTSLGFKPRSGVKRILHPHDSSDEEGSSGDEDRPAPPDTMRKRRKRMDQAELDKRSQRWYQGRDRDNPSLYLTEDGLPNVGALSIEDSPPGDNKDYIIIELFANGTLWNFICRMNAHKQKVPGRILWSFWLCMVKQCIAMAYPPRKFHPERFTRPKGDLDEMIPDEQYRWRMKRMVHFDIDPQNIFVADFDMSEQHMIGPRLKLGDFGLAMEMKTQKRDVYYQSVRKQGKNLYFTPESFAEEWDHLDVSRNGSNVCDARTAGSFGPETNVYMIGNVGFNLVTGLVSPNPPLPGFVNGPDGQQTITYGWRILESTYEHVDMDLRTMIARCMCHYPDERPSLEELLAHAQAGLAKAAPAGQSDDEVRTWLRDYVHSASVQPEDPPTATTTGTGTGTAPQAGPGSSSGPATVVPAPVTVVPLATAAQETVIQENFIPDTGI